MNQIKKQCSLTLPKTTNPGLSLNKQVFHVREDPEGPANLDCSVML